MDAAGGRDEGRAAFFDRLYTERPDPWGLQASPYERAKYERTLQALPRRRWQHALEIGCSIGTLTERLQAIADRVTGVDVSAVALERARARVPGATFLRAEVPEGWPHDAYDLVVLSEVLYFLRPDEVRAVAELVRRDLAPQGTVVLVNWTGPNDRELDGEAAAALFTQAMGRSFRTERVQAPERPEPGAGYRIDVSAE